MDTTLESVFCLFLGRRRTKRQKTNFLKKCVEQFNATGYSFEFSKVKTAVSENINLYFGNVNKAKIIVCAYYDTPDKKIFSKDGYYPFDGERNNRNKVKEKIGINLIFYIIALPLLFALFIDEFILYNYPLPIKILIVFFVILVGIKINFGFYNTLNFNCNTSSIITMIQYANKNKFKKDVAYAFIDGGTTDYLGAKLLAKDMGNNDALVIFLDCIGCGKDIVIGVSKCYEDTYKNLGKVIVQSKFTNHYFFKKYVVITVSNKQTDIKSTVVINAGTKKDIILDYDMMSKVENCLDVLTI
ncbi:MAG: hypothetical protein RR598_02700 [Anaerorhabdus sp.]|uniref:hypothetical protein n=1 Tax=Anaerorhabdus sp. TaxID=1872524 RepID=UPI002FC64A75